MLRNWNIPQGHVEEYPVSPKIRVFSNGPIGDDLWSEELGTPWLRVQDWGDVSWETKLNLLGVAEIYQLDLVLSRVEEYVFRLEKEMSGTKKRTLLEIKGETFYFSFLPWDRDESRFCRG